MTHVIDVSKHPKSASSPAAGRDGPHRTSLKGEFNGFSINFFFFSKRELLLAKIRDQATQIKDLMAQLEAIQMSDRNMTASLHTEFAHSSILGSPGNGTLTDSFGHSLDASSTLDTASSASRADSVISQENLEWIRKARESLEAFGDSIRLGSSSTAKKDLVDQDLEDSPSSEGEYGIANESSGSEDEFDIGHLSPKARGPVHERKLLGKSSPSSAKMVSLPAQASPFGMMAALSVGRARTKRPASVVSDASDLGVANEDFFRTRRCMNCERSTPLTT